MKKKEKEERRAQQEAEAAEQIQRNGGVGNRNMQPDAPTNRQQQDGGLWYFYNQMAVIQGKSAFEKQWGKRENTDDWQRINKTVVGGTAEEEELTEEMLDSIAAAEAVKDSLDNVVDSAKNDPHKREYYLEQIPFSEEAKLASHLIIQDGLFNSGVIFKDKFDNLPLSKKQFDRLTSQYPNFDRLDETYYHLFLLYSRMGQHATASNYVDSLRTRFADSQWTKVLTDPYFKENAQLGEQLEDSLYAATYDAFLNDNFDQVAANAYLSETRFPLGANRDKFIFISGLSQLNRGNATACVENMEQIVKNYPQSRISEMAGMIVNGVREGRRLHGGKFDLGDVWDLRSDVLQDKDSTVQNKFSAERNVSHRFMLVYNPDSINENQLLYEMARFNFTNYLVRNFELSIEEIDGICRMSVMGFQNFDEAHLYTRHLYENKTVAQKLAKTRGIIISDNNLPLLGTTFSYKDYDQFYTKHFAPIVVTNPYLLTEPTEIAVEREKESSNSEPEAEEELIENGAIVEENYNFDDTPETVSDVPQEEITVSEEPDTIATQEEISLPIETETTPVVEENSQSEVSTTVVEEETTSNTETTPVEEETEETAIDDQTQEETDSSDDGFVFGDDTLQTDDDDDGFFFDDETDSNTTDDDDEIIIIDNNNTTVTDDDFDVDDEYFELEGF